MNAGVYKRRFYTLVKSSLERKLKTLQNKLQEVYDLETQAQETMFEKSCNTDEIRKWSAEIEGKVAKFEKNVQELQEAIKCINQAEIQHTKQEEQKFACQLQEQQMEQEMKFEQAKLEQKLKMEKKAQL